MNIIIHRGTHQIGGSCIELSTKKTRIILDIGKELPSIDEEKRGKRVSLPIVSGLYKDDKQSVDAVLISHGHGDHVGLIHHVNPLIPVYMGEKATKIFNMTAKFTGNATIENPLNYFVSGQSIKIGDFKVTPYLVDHSGFDAYAFVIMAENKCVVYTADYREHGRKKQATKYFQYNIPNQVDALLIEGTMMSRANETIKTESEIEKEATDFMKTQLGPILVLQSTANIDRLVSMYKAAKRSNRIFVMDIFTAQIVAQTSDSIPQPGKFEDIRVFYPGHLTNKMFKHQEGGKLMNMFSQYKIKKDELGNRSDYCMVVRESMIADLMTIKNIHESGFIYSKWSGYKIEKRTKALLDYAKSKKMTMIDLHTSGHACLKTLQKTINNSKPKKIIPIHTEKPDSFAEIFKNVYIAKDGEVISI